MVRESATTGWVRDLKHIYTRGLVTAPRGIETREVLGFQSIIDMKRPIINVPVRDLGFKFMAAEAAWILGGDNRVSSIAPYSKQISKFSDDGVTFFGAYGPRILDQLQQIVLKLVNDPSSRQAVLTIWRPNPPGSKDIPCTVAIQWLIRDGKLHCIDSMRSSDIWLGHPYDVFNFSMVSLALLIRLRNFGLTVELGDLNLVAGSKHLYQTDFNGAQQVFDSVSQGGLPEDIVINPSIFETQDDLVERLWEMATSSQGALETHLWHE